MAIVAALFVLCNAATILSPPTNPVFFGPLRPWLSPAFFPAAPEPRASMHDWLSASLSSVKSWALHAKAQLPSLTPRRSSERGDLPDLYWRFIPLFQAAITPGADAHWNTTCWEHVTASAAKSDTGLTITVAASSRVGAFDCRDSYLLATVEGVHLVEVASDRIHTIHWNLDNATASDLTWIERNGVRAFRFMDDWSLTLDELLHTVRPLLCHPPPHLLVLIVFFFPRSSSLLLKFLKVGASRTARCRRT
jgi:hypothetical protein